MHNKRGGYLAAIIQSSHLPSPGIEPGDARALSLGQPDSFKHMLPEHKLATSEKLKCASADAKMHLFCQ